MPAPNPVRELIKRSMLDRAPYGSYQDRIELFDPCARPPFLAASMDPNPADQGFDQDVLRALTIGSKDWILSGTNAADANSTLDVDGGWKLVTAAADNDQMIVSPASAINSVNISPWRAIEWEPEHAPRFEATIELASIADVLVHVGLGLTAALDLTTDNDQVKFQFSSEGSTSDENWTACWSIGGTDTEKDTGIAAVAGKSIRLGIHVNESRVPRFFINGVKVCTGEPLTAGANLIPFVGIQALTTAAKTLYVRNLRGSRLLNDFN